MKFFCVSNGVLISTGEDANEITDEQLEASGSALQDPSDSIKTTDEQPEASVSASQDQTRSVKAKWDPLRCPITKVRSFPKSFHQICADFVWMCSASLGTLSSREMVIRTKRRL